MSAFHSFTGGAAMSRHRKARSSSLTPRRLSVISTKRLCRSSPGLDVSRWSTQTRPKYTPRTTLSRQNRDLAKETQKWKAKYYKKAKEVKSVYGEMIRQQFQISKYRFQVSNCRLQMNRLKQNLDGFNQAYDAQVAVDDVENTFFSEESRFITSLVALRDEASELECTAIEEEKKKKELSFSDQGKPDDDDVTESACETANDVVNPEEESDNDGWETETDPEEEEEPENQSVKSAQRRSQRRTQKILSYKEPSLQRKMRQGDQVYWKTKTSWTPAPSNVTVRRTPFQSLENA